MLAAFDHARHHRTPSSLATSRTPEVRIEGGWRVGGGLPWRLELAMQDAIHIGEVLTEVMKDLHRRWMECAEQRPKRASEWDSFPQTFNLPLAPHCGELDYHLPVLRPHYLATVDQLSRRLPKARREVVYCFVAEESGNRYVPMYVGQSTRPDLRMAQHLEKERGISHGLRSMEVRGYVIRVAFWTTCPCLLDWMEDRLIRKLRPLLNREEGQPWETEICTCGAYS